MKVHLDFSNLTAEKLTDGTIAILRTADSGYGVYIYPDDKETLIEVLNSEAPCFHQPDLEKATYGTKEITIPCSRCGYKSRSSLDFQP
jgi:hypothetical protein